MVVTAAFWAGVLRLCIASTAALAMLATPSAADPPPCRDTGWPDIADGPFTSEWGVGQYGVPVPGPCPTAGFKSHCWHAIYTGNTAGNHYGLFTPYSPDEWMGFPLNIQLFYPLGPGDYPARSRDVRQSSDALVPQRDSDQTRGEGLPERPILAGNVDLITGVPLIQETDLELPFGGSVFRHTRTYSEPASANLYTWDLVFSNMIPRPTDHFWDWNGTGWMISENPILLVDATVRWSIPQDQIVTYLVLDAHHKIPFRFSTIDGTYTAEPRYDALLAHNGDWDEIELEWDTAPTEFYVWLHGGLTKYTFDVVREDVPHTRNYAAPYDPISAHEPPGNYVTGGGWGVPYYALLRWIDDTSGNRVVIEYCQQQQWTLDHAATDNCTECMQNCNEKGQIKRVQLISRQGTPQQSVEWTLLYYHRAFLMNVEKDSDPPVSTYGQPRPEIQGWMGPHALESIYAYPGDVAIDPGCTTLEPWQFWNAEDLEEIDAITPPGLPAGWDYRVKYVYAETPHVFRLDYSPQHWPDNYVASFAPSLNEPVSEYNGPFYGENYNGPTPRLLKTTVTRRQGEGPEQTESSDTTLYRYMYDATIYSTVPGDLGMSLVGVYRRETVSGIVNALRTHGGNPDATPNDVMRLTSDAMVPFLNPSTGEVETLPLAEAADLRLSGLSQLIGPVANSAGGDVLTAFKDSPLHYDLVEDYVLHGGPRTMFDNGGKHTVVSRGTMGEPGFFRMYRFLVYPTERNLFGGASHFLTWSWPWYSYHRAVYDEPYQIVDQYGWEWDAQIEQPPFDDPMWVTVIDSHVSSSDVYRWDFTSGAFPTPQSRRVVMMNPAGVVLVDRTYTFDGGAPVGGGIAEESRYDEHMRIVEKRSKGWSAAPQGEQPTTGLVWVYQYDDSSGQQRKPSREGIKQGHGESQTIYWLRRADYHQDDLTLATVEVEFSEPQIDPNYQGPGAQVTETRYVLETVQGLMRKRLREKSTISPAVPRAPGGPAYFGVTREYFNDYGQPEWTAYGQLLDGVTLVPDAGSGDRYYLDYKSYDGYGRPELDVADAVPGFDGVPASPPNGYVRVDEGGPAALRYKTQSFYGAYGLSEVRYPGGRRQLVFYDVDDQDPNKLYQRVYRDVEDIGGGFRLLRAPQRSTFIGSTLVLTEEGRLTSQGSTPTGEEPFEVTCSLIPTLDASGRMTGMEVIGEDGAAAQTAVDYDGYAQVKRTREISGTLNRNVRDELGRLRKVYRGTKDKHQFWGTIGIGEPVDDDMMLLQKQYYGTGVTNAHELTSIRYFRDKLATQYDANADQYEDAAGYVDLMQHDWRMRQVVLERRDEQGATLLYEVSYFDNLDRSRMTAVYGPSGIPAEVHPALFGPGASVPTAAQIYSYSPAPLSLTEQTLDSAGRVQQTREYQGAADKYLATKIYYDHSGRPVWVEMPNSPVQRLRLDALGRPVRMSTFSADLEMSRLERQYDTDGFATQETSYERVTRSAGTSELDTANSVRRYRWQWFDINGSVIAVADFGTSADDFVDSELVDALGNPIDRNDPAFQEAPRKFQNGRLVGVDDGFRAIVGPAVKVWCYEMDEKSRQIGSLQPDFRSPGPPTTRSIGP
ncbi:MAG: hypothetical protein L6Q35_06510 [Phycisphaerales bacterium]|nr:hypothetical protein [Phycisphaerales bacterium]